MTDLFMERNSNLTTGQPYSGKELDPMHGLNTYDYGARQYNPILPRWDRIDPLAEKYYNVSPYTYCANNPVKFIDPNGKDNIEFFPMNNDGIHDNVSLIDYAIQFPWKSGRIDVFAHGNPMSISFVIATKASNILLTNIEELAQYNELTTTQWDLTLNTEKNNQLDPKDVEIFKALLSQSSEWDKKPSQIVLHSCGTGAEMLTKEEATQFMGVPQDKGITLGTNIAKELSRNLKDIEIIAPSSFVGPERNWIFTNDVTGERINNNGHWNVYFNGEKVREMKANQIWDDAIINQ
ncbi:RHS repeat domain-containing protein [Prevotella dentasini]|uniref:RHS repeat domain-containing protein n=1 Tax=Prevotella dentasini TaxID=589537 RepID=UPI00046A99CD|nr:RHS repeat-associated core domain-containing protein [Prevotella dentasini]